MCSRNHSLVLGIVVAAVLWPTSAAAMTYQVINNYSNGAGSLRDGVWVTNANPGPDVIEILVGGIIEPLGGLEVTDDLTITGSNVTIDSTKIEYDDYLFHVQGQWVSLSIEGVRMRGWSTTAAMRGIVVDPNNFLNLFNVEMDDFSWDGPNGGACIYGDNAHIQLRRSVLHRCISMGGPGGAISVHGGSAALIQTRVFDNYATAGGGVSYQDASGYIEGSSVFDNVAESTGFKTLQSFGASGGGLLINGQSDVDMLNSTISGNLAQAVLTGVSIGGNVYVGSGATIEARFVTLANGSSDLGTAFGASDSSASLQVSQSIMDGEYGKTCHSTPVISAAETVLKDATCQLSGLYYVTDADISLAPLGPEDLKDGTLIGPPGFDSDTMEVHVIEPESLNDAIMRSRMNIPAKDQLEQQRMTSFATSGAYEVKPAN